MGGKVFKRGVVYSIAVAIATFVPQSKILLLMYLKCKARLKAKFKCIPYSAKFWRGKTLANQQFSTFGEENFGEC